MSTSSPSHLLNLPAEIREEIFSHVLSPSAARIELPDDYVKYRFHLGLFRVNRQVYREARHVFYRLNTFVRIETPWPEAKQHITEEGRVPLVVCGDEAEVFEHAHLWVDIEPFQYSYPLDKSCNMVLLLDDLAAFCKIWYYSDLTHPGLNMHLRLTLRLRNPHKIDDQDSKLPKSLQQKLLEPFGCIKSLNDTQIFGQYDESVFHALCAAQAIPNESPEECLEKATRLKDAGNVALKKNEPREAIRLYEEAFLAIHIVCCGRRRSIWGNAHFETILGSGQYESQHGQLVRLILRVKLVANIMQAYIKLENWEEVKFWGMRSIQLMRESMGIDPHDEDDEPMLGFAAANEMGKIYYRTGLACKYMENTEQARKLFRVAARYLPRDPLVARDLASVALRI
ncbi:uncharacterized protein IWZ02DRAFT_308128 [Phyllosticta citriasiana]|uniref:Tetratricopeptide-like helical n=1 Tax=Phyllosticta citriasiana TaxID=595635 RepID=A0ABR1KYP4_9PEZI